MKASSAVAESPSGIAGSETDDPELAEYRKELDAFRAAFGGVRSLPDVPFFLFGLGARPKLIYKAGTLVGWPDGKVLRRWAIKTEQIVPPACRVRLTTTEGRAVMIEEDERGVWIQEADRRTVVGGSTSTVHLPSFQGYPYPRVMRVLHQELLVNVVAGKPVPCLFVYSRPWYRDGAMTAMCFKATENLGLIRDWILGLSDPFDRNNSGETEADNPGEVLYLLSLVSDRNHPLVPRVLDELARFEVHHGAASHIQGRTDFADHPVYQTRWAKLGLKALGLPDPYSVPRVQDSYASLFWMDANHDAQRGSEAADREKYPYLGWAVDHYRRERKSPISNRDYPLTWERDASQAHYEGIRLVSEVHAQQRIAAPHTWHAAEVLLYLLDRAPVSRSGAAVPERSARGHVTAVPVSLPEASVPHVAGPSE